MDADIGFLASLGMTKFFDEWFANGFCVLLRMASLGITGFSMTQLVLVTYGNRG